MPVSAARARAAAMASVSGAPPAITVAPYERHASTFASDAPAGTKISHGTPVAGGEREGLGVVASAPGDDTATGTATQIVELRQRAAA